MKGVVTPSTKLLQHQLAAEEQAPESEHTRFRGLAAWANHLAADRPDILYAAKEVCRFMAHPSEEAWEVPQEHAAHGFPYVISALHVNRLVHRYRLGKVLAHEKVQVWRMCNAWRSRR